MPTNDTAFAGSIPALYDQYFGPTLFQPYAIDLVGRLLPLTDGAILETACGTGIVTQQLAAILPATISLTATDLNAPMLQHAATKLPKDRVTFRQADALRLPFASAEFDTVVCQFGVMFFPDRGAGYREALRVMKPGGKFIFSVWDALSRNSFPEVVTAAMAVRYPQDPPRFLARTPHGHHDPNVIRAELTAAGFFSIEIETITLTSRAPSPRDAAIGFCQGTPLRGEIEARDPDGLQAATDAAADALASHFGVGAIEAPMQALVVTASA